jgi:hypothetical protein
LLLSAVLPVSAGGWAVITLDELPGEIAAGETLTVGFTVLQHGKTPMTGLTPKVTARNPLTGETFSSTATARGSRGHYIAKLNFSSVGSWEWSIEAFTMLQPMPPISVVSMKPNAASPVPIAGGSQLSPWLVTGAGLALAIGGLIFLLRRSARWSVALVFTGLLVCGFGIASAADLNREQQDIKTIPSRSTDSRGQDLFVAKGCITCHSHTEVDQDKEGTIFLDFGPGLSNFSTDPADLRLWLSDPAGVKPNSEMPDLDLSVDEIEDLITFISAE